MDISVRVEEITREAFSYPGRIECGGIWFALRTLDDIKELINGYLAGVQGGKYYESDIYDDSKNCEAVKDFDKSFK